LDYHYNARNWNLDILRRDKAKALARLDFDRSLSRDPLSYIASLEKATQIKALMYSNNTTINIAETLDSAKLSPILQSSAMLSRYAYDLRHGHYERFCEAFAEEYTLKGVKIREFVSKDKKNDFYVARIQTIHDNSVCVRGCTLSAVMAALSERAIRDLITMEFGHKFEASAQNLLRASTRLSKLSWILDDNFSPTRQLCCPAPHGEPYSKH
ncbi:MAG: hypothetical protein ACPGRX_07070, partial [Bdellovibrionales bacterium]